MVPEDRKEARHDAALHVHRDRHQSRGERADRDEADLSEGQHPGVPDEHVEPDDDRDVHERGTEVDLVRARREAAEQGDRGNEQRREHELRESADGAHARSTGRALNEAKSPSGRSKRTRITSPKTNESTYTLWAED